MKQFVTETFSPLMGSFPGTKAVSGKHACIGLFKCSGDGGGNVRSVDLRNSPWGFWTWKRRSSQAKELLRWLLSSWTTHKRGVLRTVRPTQQTPDVLGLVVCKYMASDPSIGSNLLGLPIVSIAILLIRLESVPGQNAEFRAANPVPDICLWVA